jgi:hypothetical protein
VHRASAKRSDQASPSGCVRGAIPFGAGHRTHTSRRASANKKSVSGKPLFVRSARDGTDRHDTWASAVLGTLLGRKAPSCLVVGAQHGCPVLPPQARLRFRKRPSYTPGWQEDAGGSLGWQGGEEMRSGPLCCGSRESLNCGRLGSAVWSLSAIFCKVSVTSTSIRAMPMRVCTRSSNGACHRGEQGTARQYTAVASGESSWWGR